MWRRKKKKKSTCTRGIKSCIIAQHRDELQNGDKSVQILPPFAPCDWSVPVSVRGRGAPQISICLYVNFKSQIAFPVCGCQQQQDSVDVHKPRFGICTWSDETRVYLLTLNPILSFFPFFLLFWILLPLKTHPHTWVSWYFSLLKWV